MLADLVRANRSYRRYYQEKAVPEQVLRDLVDLARLSPSAANLQPLRFILSNDPERNARIFATLGWAGYLKDWPGPPEGERPTAYIVILGDTELRKEFGCDHGIAAQSILLGAAEKGLGGCMIGNVDHARLRQALAIPERYQILLVLALGHPKEKVVLEPLGPDGDIHYYRDAGGVHHVPKRPLQDLILPLI